jgi:hypothetical protein
MHVLEPGHWPIKHNIALQTVVLIVYKITQPRVTRSVIFVTKLHIISPDAVCVHNGTSFCIPVISTHSQRVSHITKNVRLVDVSMILLGHMTFKLFCRIASSEAFTALKFEVEVSWVVTPWSVVIRYHRFRGTCYLCLLCIIVYISSVYWQAAKLCLHVQ